MDVHVHVHVQVGRRGALVHGDDVWADAGLREAAAAVFVLGVGDRTGEAVGALLVLGMAQAQLALLIATPAIHLCS